MQALLFCRAKASSERLHFKGTMHDFLLFLYEFSEIIS